jgi:signal peptidase I
MRCPSCGLENPATAQICDCGYNFETDSPPVERKKKRNPLLAAIATLGTYGLGQLYNGKPCKAAGSYLLWLIAAANGMIFPISSSFGWLLAFIAIPVLLILLLMIDAIRDSRAEKEIGIHWYNRWYIYLGIIALQLLVIAPFQAKLTRHSAAPYRISTGSMEPALKIGDRLVADMKAYKNELPSRGDLMVFQYPNDKSIPYIKRVIGLPEEKLEIKGRSVYINDQPLEENYKQHIDPASVNEHFGPYAIPQGKYFVMGDSRDNSQDSRFWGFVDQSAILGKAKYIYWSKDWSRIGENLK